ncbi:MAG: Sir2 family NAD-dependent protein deacetylase [Myxococcota bacterium]|jgi:NAD-dependent SIR2 family protein deacetylase|nr:Sir2 family NAD-dependent protein deacetylase [Myxococcota bacterium]
MAEQPWKQAAELLALSEAILITAGAGMGVDSGLPDFRGVEGFWRAYPAFRKAGLRFESLANPRLFESDPQLAWGFYAHRLGLYRSVIPHQGFRILSSLSAGRSRFVFTSNVDGHFQRSLCSEAEVYEVHGSIHHLQCTKPCCDLVWENRLELSFDATTLRARDPLPRCPHCHALARPNILMFGDGSFVDSRADAQAAAFRAWLDQNLGKALCVLELGAGTAIPTVRMLGEDLAKLGAGLIRINPRDASVPAGAISLRAGALEALRQLQQSFEHASN